MGSPGTIAAEFLLRTQNPTATITTSQDSSILQHYRGPVDARETIKKAHYQNPTDAMADIVKHPEVYLGDDIYLRTFVDRFGNFGAQSKQQYHIRDGNTMRALLSRNSFPHHQSATLCHLSEHHISAWVLQLINQGVPYSWCVVRPRFEQTGLFLVFWPSWMPIYGAAALLKLGEVVPLSEFSAQHPLDPGLIHVCLPGLSEKEFGGEHTILIGSGRKRQVVVNGGPYDGGAKKPCTFMFNEAALGRTTNYGVQHWGVTRLLNGKIIAIGNTTAAGKTEGSQGGNEILQFIFDDGKVLEIDTSRESPLTRPSEFSLESRVVYVDDICAVGLTHTGQIVVAELEPQHFNRVDLDTKDHPLPFARDCAEGRVKGPIFFYNIGFNEETQQFETWRHETLEGKTTNPRISYPTESNPQFKSSGQKNMKQLNALWLSIPVPADGNGKRRFTLPPFARLTKRQYIALSMSGLRANKGNPALGAMGDGAFALEGFFGKANFSFDTEGEQFQRDMTKFWHAVDDEALSFWFVANTASSGALQKYKFSGTNDLRSLLESWWEEMHAAPLIKLPGVYVGGVPDLSSFLPEEALDVHPPRIWDPRTYDQDALVEDMLMIDLMSVNAMNRILGQEGMTAETTRFLGDLMRDFSVARGA